MRIKILLLLGLCGLMLAPRAADARIAFPDGVSAQFDIVYAAPLTLDLYRPRGAQIEIYPNVGHGFLKGGAPDEATIAKAMAQISQFLAATFAPRRP